MLLLLTALACDAPPDTGVDWDLWAADITVSEVVPTVARVRVEGEGLSAVAVRFGEDGRAAATEVDGGWEALLLGNKPSAEIPWQVEASVGGEVALGPGRSFVTGGVPADFADIQVEADPERAWRGFLVTTLMSSSVHPIILDEDGDLVWWFDAEPEEGAISRLVVSHDLSHLIYMREQPEDRELVRVTWEGEVLERTPVPLAHHDFVELPDGTLGLIVMDVREAAGEKVIGDKVVERAPDGTETVLWSAWDHFEYDPELPTPAGSGWTHANALDYDRRTDTYTLSVRNHSALVRIDRASGEVLWQLGGRDSSLALLPPGEAFALQHQFQVRDGEVLVFDNGRMDTLESRAVGYALGPTTAELSFEYQPDPALYSLALGDVHRFEDGTTLVVFSSSGQVDQVSGDGEVLWRANLSLGAGIGYTHWRSSLYE